MRDFKKLSVEKVPDGTIRITCPPLHYEHIMELRTVVDCHDLFLFPDKTIFVIGEEELETFRIVYERGEALTLLLPMIVQVYYDYVSPYSYLSTKIMDVLEGEYEIWVEWCGLELRPEWVEFPKWWYQPTVSKTRWIERRDLIRKYGIPMADERPIFRPRTRPLLKAGEYAKTQGKFKAFQSTVFEAYYARAEDIRSEKIICTLGEKVGLDRGSLLDAMLSNRYESAIEKYRREAEQDRIFGVPTYKIGPIIIWGRDPIQELRKAIEAMGAKKRSST
jgi:predicted DsbA family dithiol-disulfide isomerase